MELRTVLLGLLVSIYASSFEVVAYRSRFGRVNAFNRLASNPNIDLFGADSVSLKLDGMERNRTSKAAEAAMAEYMKEVEEKASKSIVDSITGNRTMKAEALRLEAELDQIKFNEGKLSKEIERLTMIDEAIREVVEGKMTLRELITNPEYKFDEQFVLRIAELGTMARSKEEQALFRGYMEEILKSEECSEVTKRVLGKVTKGAGNNK